MPEVIIYAVEGRTLEQKRGLVKDITDAFAKHFESPKEYVTIQFVECNEDNKAKGGELFSESERRKQYRKP